MFCILHLALFIFPPASWFLSTSIFMLQPGKSRKNIIKKVNWDWYGVLNRINQNKCKLSNKLYDIIILS